jgi:hypothetical protein
MDRFLSPESFLEELPDGKEEKIAALAMIENKEQL